MSLLFYRFFLLLYYTGIRILAVWNFKAKLWVQGRKTFPAIDYSKTNNKVVWMHCASLGEFEQGRPLVETIKLNYPASIIIISFFSPSGYEITKKFKEADHIFYLPEDSAANAKRLIHQINPSLVLWVKYEYWFYYLRELKKNNIPTLLISGVYRPNMPFFKWYGVLWKKMLQSFTHFFVQNLQSKTTLAKVVQADKITHAGDTRFDRVISIAEKFDDIPGIKKFCNNQCVVVAGSTWEDDEAEWIHYVKIHPEIKFIIAPHEIDKENLADVKKKFPTSIFYSEWIAASSQQSAVSNEQSVVRSQRSVIREQQSTGNDQRSTINCLIIDNIGMLSRLYKYATVCYVGGGFRSDGLHNILEAAVYGKPVIFGPEFEKNFEAIEMMEHGGAICINNAVELEKILNQLLNNEKYLNETGKAAGNYVYNNAGATKKIMEFIKKNAFLPVDQNLLQKDQNPSSLS
ncbi:MAG: glycosyltransferase N-terminal domain-containing protein [Ginsengibacter sp.]